VRRRSLARPMSSAVVFHPSCRNGSNHKGWFDFDPITAGFEVGAKSWAVENPLSKIGEL
jgi:hypothetical protein